jgi:hypothetical protein
MERHINKKGGDPKVGGYEIIEGVCFKFADAGILK